MMGNDNKMYGVWLGGNWTEWFRRPILSEQGLVSYLDAIETNTHYIKVVKPTAADAYLAKFFGMPEEKDKFVEFMFDLSMNHEILGVGLDDDPTGSNLFMVIKESMRYKTNIDAEVIDAFVRKFEKGK